jgi:formylglycine-generating enzyme required for sulfatase activity
LYADVTLTHPYAGLARYTAFDVRGIVITGSDYVFSGSGRKVSWTGEHIRMLCPDGFTSLFNPTEFPENRPGPPALRYIPGHYAPGGEMSATLNPFMSFSKDADRRMFAAGSSDTRTIYLDLVPGKLEFGYAVDACWAPVDFEINDPAKDFPPSANCQEPYVIFTTYGSGLMPAAGSSAQVQVELWDHQGADTISAVTMEAPDLFAGAISLEKSTATGEGITYTGKLTNELGAPIGDYPLLVRVIDREKDPNLGQIDAWNMTPVKVTERGYPLNELIHIPKGEFWMGVDPSNDPVPAIYAVPCHRHPTGEYYIGRFEVTFREFGAFIAAGGYNNPDWWSPGGWEWRVASNQTVPMDWEYVVSGIANPDWPIDVEYAEAEAFCNWAGGRLPSEAEWERGARGDSDKRIYPWGDVWDPSKASHEDNPGWTHRVSTKPVGSFSPEGDSPWRLADCAGSRLEMTSDWWDQTGELYERYASGDFTPPQQSSDPYYAWLKVCRGGCYNDPIFSLRCANKGDTVEVYHGGRFGFRIAFGPTK